MGKGLGERSRGKETLIPALERSLEGFPECRRKDAKITVPEAKEVRCGGLGGRTQEARCGPWPAVPSPLGSIVVLPTGDRVRGVVRCRGRVGRDAECLHTSQASAPARTLGPNRCA